MSTSLELSSRLAKLEAEFATLKLVHIRNLMRDLASIDADLADARQRLAKLEGGDQLRSVERLEAIAEAARLLLSGSSARDAPNEHTYLLQIAGLGQ
jgi:hypothetical protein